MALGHNVVLNQFNPLQYLDGTGNTKPNEKYEISLDFAKDLGFTFMVIQIKAIRENTLTPFKPMFS